MSLNNIAQEYFSSINSMAKRICVDMEETKSSFEHLWHKLPEEEKNQILTDSIIQPCVLLKYDMQGNKINLPKNYATKIIVDDNCSYNDEHSAPFSFRTKSQRDLTLLCQSDKKSNFKTSISKDESVIVPKLIKPTTNLDLDNVSLITDTEADNIYTSQNLPRTGLDLLDNW